MKQKRGKGKKSRNESQPPKEPNVRMKADEPVLFFHLVAALRILLGSAITEDGIKHATEKLDRPLSDLS